MISFTEAVFSGFISKVINDTVDISKDKIKRTIEDKNNQNIFTKIYHVIENALNTVTSDRYKNSDILYDAAEKLFRSFKNSGNNLNAVRSGLSVLTADVGDDLCIFFLDKFYDGICNDDYLFKKISLILQEQGVEYNKSEFQELNTKIENNQAELINKMESMTETLSESMSVILIEDVKFQNNKKDDYIKTWNNRLFLHMDNDERPITLADAFIMPDFKPIKKIGIIYNDTLEMVIEKFISYNKTVTMLITGVPGIGKSTITSWIANIYKENDKL